MNSLYTNEQLTELYEKTQSSVYAVVYSIVKNEQDALDLTQDAYISAFTNIEKISDIEKFDKWVIQIAANKCKDFLRKKKPTLFSQVGEEDEDFEKDIPDSSDAYNPDVVLESKEKKDIIKNILYSLPEDQRLCLVLYYGQELKISEIASALGVSENTVKSRLTYGKKKMKEQVEELERKGTKLHGIAGIGILPLIRELFASNSIASPPAGVLSATELLTKATQGANVVKQATSISKVFAKLTSIVTKNLATKIISATVATAVVATGAVAIIKPDLFSKQTIAGTVSDGYQTNKTSESEGTPFYPKHEPFPNSPWVAYFEDDQYFHAYALELSFEKEGSWWTYSQYFRGILSEKDDPDVDRYFESHGKAYYIKSDFERGEGMLEQIQGSRKGDLVTVADFFGHEFILQKKSEEIMEVISEDTEFVVDTSVENIIITIKRGTKFYYKLKAE